MPKKSLSLSLTLFIRWSHCYRDCSRHEQWIIGFNEPFGKCQTGIPSRAMSVVVILFRLLESLDESQR